MSLVALAACSVPAVGDAPPGSEPAKPALARLATAPAPRTPSRPTTSPPVALAPAPAVASTSPTTRRLTKLTAPPAGVIAAIPSFDAALATATEDGTAAVTANTSGAIRLWPSLDGSREPVVVVGPRPVALAIARDGQDLALADLDLAGSLDVLQLSASGEPRSRAHIQAPRPFTAVVAVTTGFVATTDDQRLEVFSLDGTARGALTPEPGTRLGAVVTRRGRALALFASREGAFARWLELDGVPAWGATTGKLPIDPFARAALSPDHRHLLAMYPPLHTAAYVDLTTGKAFALPSGYEDQPAAMLPIGFTGPHQVAVENLGDGQIAWWDGKATHQGYAPSRGGPPGPPALAVDGRVLVAELTHLVLDTPVATQFLGYELGDLERAQPVQGGWLLVSWSNYGHLVRTDAHFRERERIDLPALDGELTSVTPVDEHELIVTSRQDSAVGVYSVDLRDRATTRLSTGVYLSYEARSHVLAVIDDGRIDFARYDPDSGRFGSVASVPGTRPHPHNLVYLTDPAQAHGVLAVIVTTAEHGAHLNEVRALCETCEPWLSLGPDVELPAGKWLDALPVYGIVAEPNRAISPDGKRVAELADGRIRLRERGKLRWTANAYGAAKLVWNARGELFALGAGTARIDTATGELRERQCGWRFGLYHERLTTQVNAPLICDAP